MAAEPGSPVIALEDQGSALPADGLLLDRVRQP